MQKTLRLLPTVVQLGCTSFLFQGCQFVNNNSIAKQPEVTAPVQSPVDTIKSKAEVPEKYTLLRKEEGEIDILVDRSCTKENCRWIIRAITTKHGKCGINIWTSRTAWMKYDQFYKEEDRAYDERKMDQFKAKYSKNGRSFKEYLSEIEQLRADNIAASTDTDYITYKDGTQERY